MKKPRKMAVHLEAPRGSPRVAQTRPPGPGRSRDLRKTSIALRVGLLASLQVTTLMAANLILQVHAAQQVASSPFPGVSRDLASFCSARPSLSIDLAPMIVHVKRNTTFNYKLYLFSNSEHVFQTGQVVPRDAFRIHSFPVKLRQLRDFLPLAPQQNDQDPPEVYQQRPSGKLVRLPAASFRASDFFSLVPLEHENGDKRTPKSERRKQPRSAAEMPPSASSPGDILASDEPAASANAHIQFDRDDQLASLDGHSSRLARELLTGRRLLAPTAIGANESSPLELVQPAARQQQSLVLPVGSFSSFHVNTSYFARKDFGQTQAQVLRLRVDPQRFQVSEVLLLSGFGQLAADEAADKSRPPSSQSVPASSADDWAFLSHKLLRDTNTRITSITQIYEDWITRNFYTIVYVQRRLDADVDAEESEGAAGSDEPATRDSERPALTTDRLVFRGSSTVLLGADQLEYHVKASAFVTEKNGLHYYLEFLPGGKFLLGAIDWTKRPFKFIDARSLPIKQTRTLLDNEELLLCPPAVCYSDAPLDEIVSYGRLALGDKLHRDALALSRSSTGSPAAGKHAPSTRRADHLADELVLFATNSSTTTTTTTTTSARPLMTTSAQSEPISLDALIESVRLAAGSLGVRLHLRDWVWSLPRVPGVSSAAPLTASNATTQGGGGSKFAWHFEWAKRNEVKVSRDTYGFALTGHEIDASYRVFNELYLISANQLISIDYSLPNETVTSVQSLEEEFPGLSSTLLDPITGAFYDRYANQIYFFKGERYIGFDYASKRPLEDFVLPPGADFLLGSALAVTQSHASTPAARLASPPPPHVKQRALISSLPVVALLGRQHRVDAVYHDLHDDHVYIFSGMKFYTHRASDFKDGAFKSGHEPSMRCINEHFLQGCRFDDAFPNPCKSPHDEHVQPAGASPATKPSAADSHDSKNELPPSGRKKEVKNASLQLEREAANFSDEQQSKLRTIAARNNGRLIDFLLENTFIAQGATRAIEPVLATSGQQSAASPAGSVTRGASYDVLTQTNNSQERIVIYLLVAMVLITILVTLAMIVVILNWAKLERRESAKARASETVKHLQGLAPGRADEPRDMTHMNRYLEHRYHQQQLQQLQQQQQQQQRQWQHNQRSLRNSYLAPETLNAGGVRHITQQPLPSPPPPVGPKPPRSAYAATLDGSTKLSAHEPSSIIDSSAL